MTDSLTVPPPNPWSDQNIDSTVDAWYEQQSILAADNEKARIDSIQTALAQAQSDSTAAADSIAADSTSALAAVDSLSAFDENAKTNAANTAKLEGLSEDIDHATTSKSIAEDFAPYLVLGGAEALMKWGKMPKWKGFGGSARAGGAFALAFDMGVKTQNYMREFLQKPKEDRYFDEFGPYPFIGGEEPYKVKIPFSGTLDPMHEGVAYGTGAVAGAATYGFARHFVNKVLPNIRIGMASEGFDAALNKAGKEVNTRFIEKFAEKQFGKNYRNANLLNKSKIASTDARIKSAVTKAKKAAEPALQKVMKERLGSEAAKSWDEMARKLIEPGKAQKVGAWLARNVPGGKALAAKLLGSATAIAIPEALSTTVGIAVGALAIYDLYNIAQSAPDLYKLIFSEDTRNDESQKVEVDDNPMSSKIISSMVAPPEE